MGYDVYESANVQAIDGYVQHGNVQAIDGQEQQQHNQLGQYDYYRDMRPNNYYDNGLYDPTLIVAGIAVFALLICFAFMVSVGIGIGCYFLGRMKRQSNAKFDDEIVYDAVDQRGNEDENI